MDGITATLTGEFVPVAAVFQVLRSLHDSNVHCDGAGLVVVMKKAFVSPFEIILCVTREVPRRLLFNRKNVAGAAQTATVALTFELVPSVIVLHFFKSRDICSAHRAGGVPVEAMAKVLSEAFA